MWVLCVQWFTHRIIICFLEMNSILALNPYIPTQN